MSKTQRASSNNGSFNKLDSHLSNYFRDKLSELLLDLKATYELTQRNDLSLLASSVSFFCIFSLFPMFILCFIGMHHFMGSDVEQSSKRLIEFLQTVVPTMAPVMSNNILMLLKRNTLSNLMGISVLFWATYELFQCLHTVFMRISVAGRARDFVGSNVIAMISFVTVGLAATLILILFTEKAAALKVLFGQRLNGFSLTTLNYASLAAAVFLVVANVTFIYKFMPTQSVRLWNAFKGSLLFVAFFFAGRAGYQIYVQSKRGDHETIYGIFSTLTFVVIWIYYLSTCFIYSAQYAIYLEEKNKKK